MRLALAAAIAFLPAATALADPVKDAIEARQSYFTLLGANIGPLAAMAKGEVAYDAETAQLHADNLGQMAGYDATPHFPEGSSKADRPGDTRALAGIWEDFEGFSERYGDFVEAAEKLQAAAGAGRGSLGPAVGNLGEACKACHEDYRAEDF